MISIKDIGLRRFGDDLQFVGLIYQTDSAAYAIYLPGEEPDGFPCSIVQVDDWEEFVRQLDRVEVEVIERAHDGTVTKVFARKSIRMIEAKVSWAVYKRDGYVCRYCGNDGVLTVDHLVTWESGGPSTEANLVTCCKRCNRIRGNLHYGRWLAHDHYRKVSKRLSDHQRGENEVLLTTLDSIPLRLGKRKR